MTLNKKLLESLVIAPISPFENTEILEKHVSCFIEKVLKEKDIDNIKKYALDLLVKSNNVISDLYYTTNSEMSKPEYYNNIMLITNESKVAIEDYLENNPSFVKNIPIEGTVTFTTENGIFVHTNNPFYKCNSEWMLPIEEITEDIAQKIVESGDTTPWLETYKEGYRNYEIDDVVYYSLDTAFESFITLLDTLNVDSPMASDKYIIKLK